MGIFLFNKKTKSQGVLFRTEETQKTPEVVINHKEGIIKMKGKSIMEDSTKFYEPILEKLDWYKDHAPETTRIMIHLDYFNTTASKYLLKIFKSFEDLYTKKKKEVSVLWYYEEGDLDMKYCGEDYSTMLKLPFKLVEVME